MRVECDDSALKTLCFLLPNHLEMVLSINKAHTGALQGSTENLMKTKLIRNLSELIFTFRTRKSL